MAVFTGVDGRPRLATTSDDRTVRVWDPQTGTQDGPALTGHTSWVTGVAVFTGADGRPRLATTSGDETVRVWDPQTSTQDGPALDLGLSPGGVFAWGNDLVVTFVGGCALVRLPGA